MATSMHLIKIRWPERILDYLLKRYPCTYCHRACPQSSKYSSKHVYKDKVIKLNYWDCQRCQVKYWNNSEGTKITRLQSIVNDKIYVVYLEKNSSSVYIEPWLFNDKIIDFPYRLDITPKNVKDKLQTILTFL